MGEIVITFSSEQLQYETILLWGWIISQPVGVSKRRLRFAQSTCNKNSMQRIGFLQSQTAFDRFSLLIRYYRKNNLPSSQRLCKYYVGMSYSYSQVMNGLKITAT